MTLSPLVVVRLWRIQKPNVVASPICLHVAFYLHDLFTDYTLSCHLGPKEQWVLQFIAPWLHLCLALTPSNSQGEGPRGHRMSCCYEGEPTSIQKCSPNTDSPFRWLKVAPTPFFFMMCSSPCTVGSEFTRCLSYLSEQGKTNDVPSVSDELNNTSLLWMTWVRFIRLIKALLFYARRRGVDLIFTLSAAVKRGCRRVPKRVFRY